MLGARESLIEKLLDGYEVGGLRLADLIDCDLDQGRLATKDAAGLLCSVAAQGRTKAQEVDAMVRIEKLLRSTAERHIDDNAGLILEQAEQEAIDEQA